MGRAPPSIDSICECVVLKLELSVSGGAALMVLGDVTLVGLGVATDSAGSVPLSKVVLK